MDQDQLLKALKIVATVGTGLFAGNAVSVALTDIPMWKKLKVKTALGCLRWKFELAKRSQSSLAISAGLAGLAIYCLDRANGVPWLASGCLMLNMGAVAKIMIGPVVLGDLLDPQVLQRKEEAVVRYDFEKFARMHAFRSVLALTSFGICVYQLVF